MIDITVMAVPADRERAIDIVEGISAAGIADSYRTQLHIQDSSVPGVSQRLNRALEHSACVVVCWSRNTDAADEFRAIATGLLSEGKVISIEFDPNSRPKKFKQSTTYPLHGWRRQPRHWQRFVFGNCFVEQVAVAAQKKAQGIDPPPPSAYVRLVRKQAWTSLLAVAAGVALMGELLGVSDRFATARWRHPEVRAAFDSAVASPESCEAVRQFAGRYRNSPWSEEASRLISTCRLVDTVYLVRVEQALEVVAESTAEVQREGESKCATLARNAGAKVLAVRIEDFVPDIQGRAICTLEQPRTDQIERMASSARDKDPA